MMEAQLVTTPSSTPIDGGDLRAITEMRAGGCRVSPYIQARLRAGYYPPQEHYEALLHRLVTSSTSWLDVGCGLSPFPGNDALAKLLSQRCRCLTGVDPDEGVKHNPFLHERYQSSLDELSVDTTFDLVSARMVVEHVTHPANFAAALRRLTHPGSEVVFFTVNWWSLTTLAAHFTPLSVHHLAKRLLWKTREQDTFPTAYLMNNRSRLAGVMADVGFQEREFAILADASLFWRMAYLRYAELATWKWLNRLGMQHWDTCILAVYQRS